MRVVEYQTEQEWLEARLDGLGASEVAGVLGVSRFASPWSIWQNKVDRVVDRTPPSEAAEAGKRLEPVTAHWFKDVCDDEELADGWIVEDPGEYTVYWSDEDLLFATPDRFVSWEEPQGWKSAVLELKAAWYDQAKRFKTALPLEYRVQVQMQLHCTELDTAYYAVLLHGFQLRWYKELRHQKFIDATLAKARQFWEYVERQTPPPTDFSEATTRALSAHYVEPEPTEVYLGEEWDHLDKERGGIDAKLADLKRRKVAIDNQLRAALGNNTIGVLPDRTSAYTWRPDSRGRRTLRKTTNWEGADESSE